MGSQTYTTGSGNWTCPSGVTSVTVECWGGGGGGACSAGQEGGGGGGGAYSKITAYATTPSSTYAYVVGAAGAGGASYERGGTGGDSYFVNTSTVLAKGGLGGYWGDDGTYPGKGGAGGAAGDGVGATKYSGGTGGQASSGNYAGGGGGAAGSDANGGDASGKTLGSGGTGGGNGARGRESADSGGAGYAGVAPGGAGGGGYSAATSNYNGGAGAAGKIIITWSDTVDYPSAPGVGSLAATGLAPTVTTQRLVTPGVGALASTGFAVAVAVARVISPGVGAVTVTGFAPTVTVQQVVAPAVGSATVTGAAPTVTLQQLVTPSVGSFTATGYAPTVDLHHARAPGVGSLTATGYAPTVTTQDVVAPDVGALVVTGYAPSVALSGADVVQPDTGALTVTGLAPTVTTQQTLTPGVGGLTATGAAPTVTTQAVITPEVGGVVVTGYAPTVSVEAGGDVVTPGLGSLTATGYAPTVTTQHVITPGTGSVTITGLAPTIAQPGFVVFIEGTDVTEYLDVDALEWSTPLNARWTLTARLEDPAAAYRPAQLDEIVLRQDGTSIWGGYIIDLDESDFAAERGIATTLTAADYSVRLDHVYLSLTTTAGDTVRDVVDAILLEGGIAAAFGITRDAAMADGVALEAQTFTDVTVSQALAHVSELSGWPYRVTPEKVLTMAAVGTSAAPAALVDGTSAWILGESTRTIGIYGNRQKVRIGTGEQDVTDTFTGDGVSRSWPVSYTLARHYGYVTVNPGGLYQPLGIYGVDVMEWTWRESNATLYQDAGYPVLTGADTVTITYVGAFPYTVTAEDAAEIAARGVWERAPVDAPDTFDLDTGQEQADALIRRYAVWPPPRMLTAVIWAHNYQSGQTVGLTSTVRDLSGNWLITDVVGRIVNGMFVQYRLSLLEGTEQQATWRDYWRGLSGTGGGGGTIAGGVAPAVPATGGAYWASLGGSALVDVSHSTWTVAADYRDWLCPADGTYTCRVQVWTLNVATSVTPRLYDVTAASAAATGTVSTSTTRAEQVLSVTGVAGHRYRLELLPSNTTHGVLGLGNIEA